MKRIICFALLILIVLSLASCTAVSYEDTNGEDDFSLQTITDKDIVDGINTTKILSSTSTGNNKTTSKAKTMSGVVELYEGKLKNESFKIVVSNEISKGNARLVLVFNDEIVHDFDLNSKDQSFVLNNATGKVYLKIAGESTGYSVTHTVYKD